MANKSDGKDVYCVECGERFKGSWGDTCVACGSEAILEVQPTFPYIPKPRAPKVPKKTEEAKDADPV